MKTPPRARDRLNWIVQVEHLLIGAALVWLSWPHTSGPARWWWVLFLILPDTVSLGPLGIYAMRGGMAAGAELKSDAAGLLAGTPDLLPRWFPPVYNIAHTYVTPLALGIAAWVVAGDVPWILAGWFIHIAIDRAAGYTLRRPDGSLL